MKAIARGESFQARKAIDCRTSPNDADCTRGLIGEPGKLITAATQGRSSRSWPSVAGEGAKS